MHSKKPSCPKSAFIIGGNDDILTQLLVFLPAKSLIRFKSVSHHWHSLISSSSFSHLHTLLRLRLRRRRRRRRFFLLRSVASNSFIFHPNKKKLVPYHFISTYTRILQSCNGLLLLECRNSPYGRKEFFVSNPTTNQSRNLSLNRDDFIGLSLIFDPSKSPYYKVLCFTKNDYKVYDSETQTWKDGGQTFQYEHGKIVNGVYWKGDMYFIKTTVKSFRFCLEDNHFYRVCKIPKIWSRGAKKNHILESNGHLYCVSIFLEYNNNYVCVFEFDKYELGWFEKYRVDLNPISAKFYGEKCIKKFGDATISLIGMIRGEREKDSRILFHVPGKIMVYRFFDEKFKVLVDFRRESYFEEDQLQFLFMNVHQLVETLAPV